MPTPDTGPGSRRRSIFDQDAGEPDDAIQEGVQTTVHACLVPTIGLPFPFTWCETASGLASAWLIKASALSAPWTSESTDDAKCSFDAASGRLVAENGAPDAPPVEIQGCGLILA